MSKDEESLEKVDLTGRQFMVKNLDEEMGIVRKLDRHPLQPQTWTYRAIVSGKTGCGKTNAVVSGITTGFWPYHRIYVFSPTIEQPAFKYLEGYMRLKEDAYFKKTKKKVSLYKGSSSLSDLLNIIDEVNKDVLNLVILDDLIAYKDWLNAAIDIAVRGRHSGIAMLILTQQYYKTPKILRDQTEIAMIFETPNRRDITNIGASLGNGLSAEHFRQLFLTALTPDPKFPKLRPFFYVDNGSEAMFRYRRFYNQVLLPFSSKYDEPNNHHKIKAMKSAKKIELDSDSDLSSDFSSSDSD